MATKIFTVVILLITAIATTFSTCKKGGLGCANTVYNFQISAQLYPDQDSIHLGDTIWIEINAPTNLIDVSSNKLVNYSEAQNLGNALSFVKFIGGGSVSDPGAAYAANEFKFYIIKGSQINNPFVEGIREYLFIEKSNLYEFKLAVIPQQTGIYSIGLSNSVNVSRKSDECTKASFDVSFANTNQHLYFLQNNRPGYTISSYEQTHLYCFKVY